MVIATIDLNGDNELHGRWGAEKPLFDHLIQAVAMGQAADLAMAVRRARYEARCVVGDKGAVCVRFELDFDTIQDGGDALVAAVDGLELALPEYPDVLGGDGNASFSEFGYIKLSLVGSA